jgi:hypothetical protein
MGARDASVGIPKRKSKTPDRNYEDDLFGLSEAEAKWGITQEAYDEACRILGGEDPVPYLEEWSERIKGRRPARPDRNFLSWLEARLLTKSDIAVPDGIEDIVASWVGE